MIKKTIFKKNLFAISLLSLFVIFGCTFSYKADEVKDNSQDSTSKPKVEKQDEESDADLKDEKSSLELLQSDEISLYTTPQKIEFTDFLSWDEIKTIATGYDWVKEGNVDANIQQWLKENPISVKEFGILKQDAYKDWVLVSMKLECEGPCFSYTTFRFAWDPNSGKKVLFTQYSVPQQDSPVQYLSLYEEKDSRTVIDALKIPKQIKVPGENAYIELQQMDVIYSDEDLAQRKIAFVDEKFGAVYEDAESGCFYVKAADGSFSQYAYDPKLFGDIDSVEITFNSGGKAYTQTDYVSGKPSGCFIGGSCYPVVNVSEDELVVTGKTENGIEVYELKNPKFEEDYENKIASNSINGNVIISETYQNYETQAKYSDSMESVSFEKFTTRKPLLFWQDPLKRWTFMVAGDAQPLAECGKPVIYLYPEKSQDVKVSVNIKEFTETIPEYGENGWFVRAEPNGSLYNYEDGQTYPYLFWEGYGHKGDNINSGFVVDRNELEEFLTKSLTDLGLNETEKKDFMEFWLNIMLENKEPYFLVSFMGTTSFNKVAPLTIEPKPETLIRVFMYYQPLNQKISLPKQELTSVERRGFTVVEWGGSSSRPWKK